MYRTAFMAAKLAFHQNIGAALRPEFDPQAKTPAESVTKEELIRIGRMSLLDNTTHNTLIRCTTYVVGVPALARATMMQGIE